MTSISILSTQRGSFVRIYKQLSADKFEVWGSCIIVFVQFALNIGRERFKFSCITVLQLHVPQYVGVGGSKGAIGLEEGSICVRLLSSLLSSMIRKRVVPQRGESLWRAQERERELERRSICLRLTTVQLWNGVGEGFRISASER